MTKLDPAFAERLRIRLLQSDVPEHMHQTLINYITVRQPIGAFLTAVLSNDLSEACVRADDTNVTKLHEFIRFLYNYAPSQCWHSKKNVDKWLTSTKEVIPNFD